MDKNERPVKPVNYTEAMTKQIVSDYQAGVSVEDIAKAVGKGVRSVRAKLVREGVYKPVEKPMKSEAKDNGPTKKEMLITLEQIVPFPVEGFEGCTKDALAAMLRHFEANPSPKPEAEQVEVEAVEPEAEAA